MGKYNLSFADFEGEESGAGFYISDLNAGNIAAQLTLVAAVRAAIEDITLGTLMQEQVIAVVTAIGGALPTNAFAQRETKWLVSGVDDDGLPRTMEIPTANLSITGFAGGQLALASTLGAALKTALDAAWKTKLGVPITVTKITHVGRNL